jgi:allantoate deiminase
MRRHPGDMATFSPSDIDAFGARAEAMVKSLGTISAEPDRLVRLFLTPEHRRAADRVAGWMREVGLEISEDALGTVRGRYRAAGEDAGPSNAKRLLIGSHIDTVIDAGMYDGPFGVIAGILAAEHFARAKQRLLFGIDVLAFGDEEGSRFPATLASSSACAGVFKPENLQLADRDGVTLADAITAYGKSPADISAAAYTRDISTSSSSAKPATPAPCRCCCGAMRWREQPKRCCSARRSPATPKARWWQPSAASRSRPVPPT